MVVIKLDLPHGRHTIIDAEDLPLAQGYRWFYHKAQSGGEYVRGYRRGMSRKKRLYLHQLFLQAPPGYTVDHINGDGLDNRRCNLRTCVKSNNNLNRKRNKNNTSGAAGVCWNKQKGAWSATIGFRKKSKFLGYYENFDDAVIARKMAEKKYFGEYARR